jgi:hypothetical protein
MKLMTTSSSERLWILFNLGLPAVHQRRRIVQAVHLASAVRELLR